MKVQICIPEKIVMFIWFFFFSFFSINSYSQKTVAEHLIEQSTYAYNLRFADTTASIALQQSVIKKAKEKKLGEVQVIGYANLALTYRRLLHVKEFASNAEISFELSKKIKTLRSIAYGNMVKGMLHSYFDENTKALNYMLIAYDAFEKINNNEYCARIASEVSYMFADHLQEKAHQYALMAYKHALKSGKPESILFARLALGSQMVHNSQSDEIYKKKSLIDFFKQTVSLAEKNENKIITKSNIGVAYINLAELYLNDDLPHNETAFLECIDKAVRIGKKYNIKNVYRSSLGLKGLFYTQKKEYTKAKDLFDEGIAYQKSLPYADNSMLAIFYNSLKELAELQGNYKDYYKYDTIFTKYNKIKYDEAALRILQNADAKFESTKKAVMIKQLEQENELQRKNKFMGYGIAALLFLGLIFMFYSYYYRQKFYLQREAILKEKQYSGELKMQLLEQETLESLAQKLALERRLLQSQMDPHFIFNALGNIQSMVLQKDTDLAATYLSQFAKLTRQVLEQSRKELIDIDEEIDTLKNYISLQQLRLNNSFKTVFHLDPDLDHSIQIPPLLIQPFIENAIEHGLKDLPSEQEGKLDIYFTEDKDKNCLICTIIDNGVGIEESSIKRQNTQHQSMATKITNERIERMLKDNIFAGFEISKPDKDVIGKEGGCQVTISIPIS